MLKFFQSILGILFISVATKTCSPIKHNNASSPSVTRVYGTKDKNKPNGLPNDTYTKCYINSIFQILASLYIDDIKSTYSNLSWKEDLIIFLKKINNPDKKITKQESTELINKLLQGNTCNLSLKT